MRLSLALVTVTALLSRSVSSFSVAKGVSKGYSSNFAKKGICMTSFANNEGAGLGSGEGAIGGKENGRTRGGREEDTSNASWFQRIETSIAKSRKVRGGNFVQIATVDEDGFPACRTVVFRGFLPFSDGDVALKMITDARSSKVAQIQNSPKCEMVYWFGKSSEQYRISGELQLVSGTEDGGIEDKELFVARKQQWGNLSDSAREQFYWPGPGDFSGPPVVPPGGRDEEGQVLAPPDSFLLLLLRPQKVKYLRLTDNFSQQCDLRVLEGKGEVKGEGEKGVAYTERWETRRVNP